MASSWWGHGVMLAAARSESSASILGVALLLAEVVSPIVSHIISRITDDSCDDVVALLPSLSSSKPLTQSLAKTGSGAAPLETLPTRQEPSAQGLHRVAQGEDASWGMKRGTRRGDVKFAHGCFLPCYLYKQQVRP